MEPVYFGISPIEFKGYKDYFEKLKSGKENVRAIAAFALGQIADNKTTNQIVEILKSESSSLVRLECIKALSKIRDINAASALIETLVDDNPSVRAASAMALGMIKAKSAVDSLISALNDMNIEVRINSIDSLAEIGDNNTLNAIISKLKDPEPQVRRHAVGALGVIANTKCIKELISMLSDSDAITRMMSAWSLAEIGEEAVDPLITVLDTASEEEKIFAIEALGLIKSEKAIPALEKIASSSETWKKNLATSAIEKIKGK